MLTAYIEGIGLIGPGFQDWAGALPVLRGDTPYQPQKTVLPVPAALPAAERRRCGAIVKVSLAVGAQAAEMAAHDVKNLPTVFAASGGDGINCHEICAMLASDDRLISPTRFHNSVHNAAAGYWSIAHGAVASSSVLCAFDGSFGAGLLEAMTQTAVDGCGVLLIASDTTYGGPLRNARPIPDDCGVGLLLTPRPTTQSLAKIEVRLTDAPADRLPDSALEALRSAIPAARSLPLLRLLARRESGTAVLDYLDHARLAVQVAPC